jgi:hypothetical protein
MLWLASPEGEATVIDLRAPAAVASGLPIHDRKVNTLALEPGRGELLASACSDGTVKVWDARRLGGGGGGKRPAPLGALGHAKSSQGAAWAPGGGGRLLSVSFDDTLAVWGAKGGASGGAPSGKGMEQLLRVKHDNQTGRCVAPRPRCVGLAAGWAVCTAPRRSPRAARIPPRPRPPPQPALLPPHPTPPTLPQVGHPLPPRMVGRRRAASGRHEARRGRL